MSKKLIECVPNVSEGRDQSIINALANTVRQVDEVKLLDVDPGAATNRTVFTFVGKPEAVLEAAFQFISKSAELIDMRQHSGEHPRMGATDVCPIIPISNVTMEEAAEYAHRLGERVGKELGLSGYYYEAAATRPDKQNLATVRSGEYEGLDKKFKDEAWRPDFGPNTFNERFGALAIGARDFLIAYNINLNTTSSRRANAVAFDVREKGRIKREGGTLTGKILRDEDGEAIREPGMCKGVKGIGWYIEEYGIAQVSMNITDINTTPLHMAFEACVTSATQRGLRVTGSELVGLVPKKVMIDAGKYFLTKQQRSHGISEEEIIKIAVKSMGLDELGPFDMRKKVIEYQLEDAGSHPLIDMDLKHFSDVTASESVAPGGGSISAYVGALGAALGTMVANLSAHKRGWDDKWEHFSKAAVRGHEIKDRLLWLVDEDTRSFNAIIEAIRLPKSTDEEKAARKAAIAAATKYAIQVPYMVMDEASKIFSLCRQMASEGNPASISDAGVGALCARAAIHGAYMNVVINCADLDDPEFVEDIKANAMSMLKEADEAEREIRELVMGGIDG